MADNLEEFLKRAAQRRQQRAPQPAAPPPPQVDETVEVFIEEPFRAPMPSRPISAPPTNFPNQKPNMPPPVPNVARGIPVRPAPSPRLDTSPHLANDITLADERMGAHLHQAFDREVSSLRNDGPEKIATHTAREDADMQSHVERTRLQNQMIENLSDSMRNPEFARAAFVASEIFKRRF